MSKRNLPAVPEPYVPDHRPFAPSSERGSFGGSVQGFHSPTYDWEETPQTKSTLLDPSSMVGDIERIPGGQRGSHSKPSRDISIAPRESMSQSYYSEEKRRRERGT